MDGDANEIPPFTEIGGTINSGLSFTVIGILTFIMKEKTQDKTENYSTTIACQFHVCKEINWRSKWKLKQIHTTKCREGERYYHAQLTSWKSVKYNKEALRSLQHDNVAVTLTEVCQEGTRYISFNSHLSIFPRDVRDALRFTFDGAFHSLHRAVDALCCH